MPDGGTCRSLKQPETIYKGTSSSVEGLPFRLRDSSQWQLPTQPSRRSQAHQ